MDSRTKSAAPIDDTSVSHPDSNQYESTCGRESTQMRLWTSETRDFFRACSYYAYQDTDASEKNHRSHNNLSEILKRSDVPFLLFGVKADAFVFSVMAT